MNETIKEAISLLIELGEGADEGYLEDIGYWSTLEKLKQLGGESDN